MLFACVLHVGLGVIRLDANPSAGVSDAHSICSRGCCAGMEFTACCCVKNPTVPAQPPVSSVPTSGAARDLVPQVAWLPATTPAQVDWAEFADRAAESACDRYEPSPQGRLVSLTVRHCSFQY